MNHLNLYISVEYFKKVNVKEIDWQYKNLDSVNIL